MRKCGRAAVQKCGSEERRHVSFLNLGFELCKQTMPSGKVYYKEFVVVKSQYFTLLVFLCTTEIGSYKLVIKLYVFPISAFRSASH